MFVCFPSFKLRGSPHGAWKFFGRINLLMLQEEFYKTKHNQVCVCFISNQLNLSSKWQLLSWGGKVRSLDIWVASVEKALQMWVAENAVPNQNLWLHTTLNYKRKLWGTKRCHFPLCPSHPLFCVKLLKVRGFYFGSDGKVSMFSDCNHRWMETVHSHSAAYEQAQLEVDSKHASQKLSHLVWFP